MSVNQTLGYHLRYNENGKRRVESIGGNATAALYARQKKEATLKAKSLGIPIVETLKPTLENRIPLSDALIEYLADVQLHKRPKTYNAYSHALKLFQQGCEAKYVDEIGRQCIMNFKATCQAEYESMHTVKNLFAYLITFLKRYGKPGLIKRTDWPKAERNEYDPYTDDGVRQMLAHCKTEKERVLILLTRGSGFRKGEIVYAEKEDINFVEKAIRTCSKVELGFRTKDCEERISPVNDALMGALQSYVQTLSGSLLFPRKDGKPGIHVDRIVKRVAKRAGVKLPKKPMHSFRVLYATSLCRAGVDIYTIQKLLGHADIETTMSYLRAMERSDPTLHKQCQFSEGRDPGFSKPFPPDLLSSPDAWNLP